MHDLLLCPAIISVSSRNGIIINKSISCSHLYYIRSVVGSGNQHRYIDIDKLSYTGDLKTIIKNILL